MNMLVMAGGSGSRLDAPVEKPLVEVRGTPMIDGVLSALADASAGQLVVTVSPNTPKTAAHLREHPLDPTVLETAGAGYVPDLQTALETVALPVVTVAADLPLLAGWHVDRACGAAGVKDPSSGEVPSVTVCVPARLKRRIGASVETTVTNDERELVPTGLNVVGPGTGERIETLHDPRLAVNVNRPGDVRVAEALCA